MFPQGLLSREPRKGWLLTSLIWDAEKRKFSPWNPSKHDGLQVLQAFKGDRVVLIFSWDSQNGSVCSSESGAFLDRNHWLGSGKGTLSPSHGQVCVLIHLPPYHLASFSSREIRVSEMNRNSSSVQSSQKKATWCFLLQLQFYLFFDKTGGYWKWCFKTWCMGWEMAPH